MNVMYVCVCECMTKTEINTYIFRWTITKLIVLRHKRLGRIRKTNILKTELENKSMRLFFHGSIP